jgi:hypothetical protein
MSDKSTRIIISCLIILLVSCFCITALGAGGLAVYYLSPQTRTNNPPEIPPTPVVREERVPATPAPSPAAPRQTSQPPSATASPAPPPAAQSAIPADIAAQMDEIENQVVEIRGLAAKEDVDRYLMTPEELRQHVIDEFFVDYTPEDARDDVIELAAFGLVEPGFDLLSLYLDLYSEQISGFYDDEIKAMYVIQGGGFQGPQRMTYAHEFVHALQDQHFNLREGLNYSEEACEDDSERCAAIQALVEGDASFTESQWLFNYSTDKDRREIFEFYRSYSSPIFDSAPPFLRESLIFPYQAGLEFVEYLYDQGGWEAVNEAYRTTPVSTSQIMHPELYPDVVPVLVDLPDLLPVLGEGWREISRNVIGEYYTYLILAHGADRRGQLRDTEARDAAAGWAGDAYLVYYNDSTRQTVMVHQAEWVSAAEAGQFSTAFSRYGSNRFGRASTAAGLTRWNSPQGVHGFRNDGDTTLWVLAPDETVLNRVVVAISRP